MGLSLILVMFMPPSYSWDNERGARTSKGGGQATQSSASLHEGKRQATLTSSYA